ncbi:MAG: PD-(D/E)XK nuclease family protein [Gammaproteobacteria bacterium]|nr:PD-(D/E)XK nuclease family protein [Gammaproteobacteria bacterium]
MAVRLAYTRVRLQAGEESWPSCDVLPFGAWLERVAAQARHGALRGLRRLGAAEEWLLWHSAAAQACEGNELLQPASLADALRRSAALARDHGLSWPSAPTAEAQVLERARQHVESRLLELGAYSAHDWPLILRGATPLQQPLVLAGCAEFGPGLCARLMELGAEFVPADPADPAEPPSGAALEFPFAAASISATPCADGTDELRRAAQWCRAMLCASPAARLLVVVPQLAQRRAAAVLAFEHELGAAAFAVEGGRPLDEYPMVRAALDFLRLCGGPLQFHELAALLRSPYIGCGTLAQRAALELTLRERNAHAADLSLLAALARGHGAAADALAVRFAGLAARVAVPRGQRHGAGEWARILAAALEAGGWPGEAALGSEEEQQQERLRALIGELALLGAAGHAPIDHGAAVGLLAHMARRTAFEPASGDVAVTLTAAVDDPVVAYTGIWVAGLGAEQWPPPAHPDPFIPMAVQRAAGLPQSTAQGQLGLARRAMRAWRRATGQLVLSWPEGDGDVDLQPSGLVAAPRGRDQPRAAGPPLPDPLYAAIAAAAAREPRPPDRARTWPPDRALPGGTRALQLQSLCPFRAVAELRLGAVAVRDPVPGFDHRERGLLLHRALQLVWDGLRDSGALRAAAADVAALSARVRLATERALRERLLLHDRPLPAPLVRNELERLVQLIGLLLQQELQRAGAHEFRVSSLEEPQRTELAGVPLRLRMDRVDRLDDGRVVVIDYKSGAPEPFDPLASRPRQVQLQAYATLAEGDVAGVAAVYLNAGEVRWRGAAAQASLLPALGKPRGPAAPWQELRAHWRELTDALAREFVAGAAAVQPLPGACRLCHLGALCRVDAVRHATEVPEADSVAAGSDAGDQSGAVQ